MTFLLCLWLSVAIVIVIWAALGELEWDVAAVVAIIGIGWPLILLMLLAAAAHDWARRKIT